MASNTYWSIKELEDKGFPRSEELVSYSFASPTPHVSGSGGGTAYPLARVKELPLIRAYDGNSVLLLDASISGQLFDVVSIWSVSMSGKTVLAKLKFNLKKCIIIAMHAAVLGSGGKMVGQLRLNFESIDQEH